MAVKPLPPESKRRTSGKAVASMVVGICGIIMPFAGFILGIIAIGLSASARAEIREQPEVGGGGMAVAGMVTGIVGLVVSVIACASVRL